MFSVGLLFWHVLCPLLLEIDSIVNSIIAVHGALQVFMLSSSNSSLKLVI